MCMRRVYFYAHYYKAGIHIRNAPLRELMVRVALGNQAAREELQSLAERHPEEEYKTAYEFAYSYWQMNNAKKGR